MIERHAALTGSPRAKRILADWHRWKDLFVKVLPMEYRLVLGQMSREDAETQRAKKARSRRHEIPSTATGVSGFRPRGSRLPAGRGAAEGLAGSGDAPDGRRAGAQAARCMDCGIPFCYGAGCPLKNPIPEMNYAALENRWEDAIQMLQETCPYPEITGRICPALCEGACCDAANGDAVAIRQIEREIADRAFAGGYMKARTAAPRNGRKVAVVGSGPTGLAVGSGPEPVGLRRGGVREREVCGRAAALRHSRLQAGEVDGGAAHRPVPAGRRAFECG
jgi:hypothetical protein